MATFQQKFLISAGSAALFSFVNSPIAYKLTGKVIQNLVDSNNCPTHLGQLIHALIFFTLTYLSMTKSNQENEIKLKHTIYGTLFYFFVSSPAMYSLTGSLLGPGISSNAGCPTLIGILLHAAVYCLALIAVMYLPN